MKIVNYTVKNYRSITDAYKIPLDNYTVFVGPNNEGKSNMLRALVLALSILSRGRYSERARTRVLGYGYGYGDRDGDIDYDWKRDFPIKLQEQGIGGTSDITIEFELTDKEKEEFHTKVRSNLSTNLKLKLGLGDREAKFEVMIKGKGKKYLSSKSESIAEFLREHIDYQYIPSIRTENLSTRIIGRMLAKELNKLEKNPEYQTLLGSIEKAQQPILASLGTRLTETVSAFIPDVKKIEIDTGSQIRRAIHNACRVYVDDGTRTEIDFKGDGIKSLTAISLMKYAIEDPSTNRTLVIAVEEPESHLHPSAIHQLKDVLIEMASKNQVIIATHSPLLADKENVRHNIIVKASKAIPAKRISEIRDVLGVRFSDNMASASIVILVEGASDAKILKTWISSLSPRIRAAIQHGNIAFDDMQGGSNLSYKAGLYKNSICNIHVYLDHDEAGKQTASKAIKEGVLSVKELNYASCPSMKESEIEDLVDAACYKTRIEREYGISLDDKILNSKNKKWTDRIKNSFEKEGKPWNKEILKEIKTIVATQVEKSGERFLLSYNRGSIDSIVDALERRIIGQMS